MSEVLCNLKKTVGGGGTLKVVNLGTSNSINIASLYPDKYTEFTLDNFFYKPRTMSSSMSYIGNSTGSCNLNTIPTLSYNAETGILTATNGNIYTWTGNDTGKNHAFGSTKYLVYVE